MRRCRGRVRVRECAGRRFLSDSGRADLGAATSEPRIWLSWSRLSPSARHLREKIANLALKKGYLRQLLDLFKTCGLDDMESLHMMYTLQGLVLLNDANLFDELLRDENVFDVVGALEYDPEYAKRRKRVETGLAMRGSGRVSARSRRFSIARSFGTASCSRRLSRLGPGVRATFTRRTASVPQGRHPQVLDDATFGTPTSIMLFNNVEVVLALQQDPAFLKGCSTVEIDLRRPGMGRPMGFLRSCAAREAPRFSSAGHYSPRSSSTGCFTCCGRAQGGERDVTAQGGGRAHVHATTTPA